MQSERALELSGGAHDPSGGAFNSAPILSVRELIFSIRGARILNGVSLDIQGATTVGIIGPNGSGKTTFFNCLSGFHAPDSGEITLRNRKINSASPAQRALLGVGRVFQSSGVFREMSLLENIVTALEGRNKSVKLFVPWGGASRKVRDQALGFLAEVGLAERAAEKAASLSGGQLRMLEIVRILAFGADLLLLDEPTAGVSPKMKGEVGALIRRLQDMGKTILIIEHDMAFIQEFCQRIVVFDQGRVVLDDTPNKVRESPRLQEIYFGR